MTTPEIISHWRIRAGESLTLARMAHGADNNADALFHCHLAIEKMLKAEIMEKTGKPHPRMHSLLQLATLLQKTWSSEDQELFDSLSDFAISARYDDPEWARQFATAENAEEWIKKTEMFISRFAL